jgi:hypothetical protein
MGLNLPRRKSVQKEQRNMTEQWRKISDEHDYVDARTLMLKNPGRGLSFALTQFFDVHGEVIREEGEMALRPLVDFSLKVQALDPDDFDPDTLKAKAAPMIAKIIGELMEDEVDVESIVESMELAMDGTWTANAAPLRLKPPPKMEQLH